MAATERSPPLTHRSAVATGEFHDEVVGIGQAGCPHNLLTGRFRIGESNVLAHRSAEQERVLGNDSDLSAQRIELNLGDVVAIDQNPAFTRLIKPRQQLHQGALAAAALANDSNERSGLDLQVDVLEHLWLTRSETEGETLKPHLPMQRRQHHL